MKRILVLTFVAVLVISIETLSAIVFFQALSSVFAAKVETINYLPDVLLSYPIYTLSTLLALHFSLLTYHNYLSQALPLKEYKFLTEKQIRNLSLRERPAHIKSYFNKLAFEILMRLGFGYYGTLSYILARAMFTIFLVAYIAIDYMEIFIISIYIVIPAFLVTLMVIYFQKILGKKISNWNNQIGVSISKKIAELTKTDRVISVKPSGSEFKLLLANSFSQSLSNANKPLIELIITIVLYLFFLKSSSELNADSFVLALLYRVYGNVTTLVSLFNLYSSSAGAKLNLPSRIERSDPGYLSVLSLKHITVAKNAINIDNSKYGGVEFRGASGIGKTLTVEHIVSNYREEGYKVFVWMSALDFPDITVNEYVENILDIQDSELTEDFIKFKKNITDGGSIAHLSLGQKTRLGMLIASMFKADIVFIDEPFANLDKSSALEFKLLICKLSKTRKVIITNHGEMIEDFRQVEFI